MNNFRVYCKNSESDQRIFIFHHSGGNASIYAKILNDLKIQDEIYLLDLPGRSFRSHEFPYLSLNQLLMDLRKEILDLETKKTIFIGHSMGAWIAYRFAFDLIKIQYPVLGLGISSFLPISYELRDQFQRKSKYKKQDWISELDNFSLLPLAIKNSPEMLNLVIHAVQSDYELLGSEDFLCSFEELKIKSFIFSGEEDSYCPVHKLNLWKNYLESIHEIKIFPGGHFHIYQSLGEVLSILKKSMGEKNEYTAIYT